MVVQGVWHLAVLGRYFAIGSPCTLPVGSAAGAAEEGDASIACHPPDLRVLSSACFWAYPCHEHMLLGFDLMLAQTTQATVMAFI